MKTYLTNSGLNLLNKLVTVEGTLRFTKAEIGTGVVSGAEECRQRTSLAEKVDDATLSNMRKSGNVIHIEIQYSNIGITVGFYMREIGLYAEDPDTGMDVMYAYGTFGENPEWIAPESTGQYVRTYDMYSEITNLTNVVVEASSTALVSKAEFDKAVEELQSSEATVILSAESWAGSGPFAQSVEVPGLGADQNGFASVAQSATSIQRQSAVEAVLSVTGQSAGSITITADGSRPASDIPVTVIMLG